MEGSTSCILPSPAGEFQKRYIGVSPTSKNISPSPSLLRKPPELISFSEFFNPSPPASPLENREPKDLVPWKRGDNSHLLRLLLKDSSRDTQSPIVSLKQPSKPASNQPRNARKRSKKSARGNQDEGYESSVNSQPAQKKATHEKESKSLTDIALPQQKKNVDSRVQLSETPKLDSSTSCKSNDRVALKICNGGQVLSTALSMSGGSILDEQCGHNNPISPELIKDKEVRLYQSQQPECHPSQYRASQVQLSEPPKLDSSVSCEINDREVLKSYNEPSTVLSMSGGSILDGQNGINYLISSQLIEDKEVGLYQLQKPGCYPSRYNACRVQLSETPKLDSSISCESNDREALKSCNSGQVLSTVLSMSGGSIVGEQSGHNNPISPELIKDKEVRLYQSQQPGCHPSQYSASQVQLSEPPKLDSSVSCEINDREVLKSYNEPSTALSMSGGCIVDGQSGFNYLISSQLIEDKEVGLYQSQQPGCYPSQYSAPEHNASCCLLGELEQHPFTSTSWSGNERSRLIQSGRPRPLLKDLRLEAVETLVSQLDWLTVCVGMKQFFCWPCLLFDKQIIWKPMLDGHCAKLDVECHKLSANHEKCTSYLKGWEMIYKGCDQDSIDNAFPKMDKNVCHIEQLHMSKEYNFMTYSLSIVERDDLIKKGKYCLEKADVSAIDDRINKESKKWLTRCDHLKKWVCWPCLLFTNKTEWVIPNCLTSYGFPDDTVSYLHEISQEHMAACLSLKIQEKNLQRNIQSSDLLVKPAYKKAHLKCLIEAICAVKKKRNNVSVPQGTIVKVTKLISSLKIKPSESFGQPVSRKIAENLVSYHEGISRSIESIARTRIVEEIGNTYFVSLILQDTSLIVEGKPWYSVIIRYVDDYDEPQERFIKFIEADYKPSVGTFAQEVISTVLNLSCDNKLIGFTYDGALFKGPIIEEFNSKINCAFPLARFFYYKKFDLKLQWKHAYSHLLTCRDFFLRISQLARFIKKAPDSVKSCIRASSNIFRTIIDNFPVIYSMFKIISLEHDTSNFTSNVWSNEFALQAKSFHTFFRDFRSTFLVVLFDEIYSSVTSFFAAFEGENKFECNQNLNAFKQYQSAEKFNRVFKKARQLFEKLTEKQMSEEVGFAFLGSCKNMYDPIVVTSVQFVADRIYDFKTWKLRENLDSVTNPSMCFTYFQEPLKKRFPLFSLESLQSQLLLTRDLRLSDYRNVSEHLRHIRRTCASGTFSDLFVYLQSVLTVPIGTIDAGTPAISRISTYLEGKQCFNDSDAFFWMEKELLSQMQRELYFYDDVIDQAAGNLKLKIH